jgi:hypothetical protein
MKTLFLRFAYDKLEALCKEKNWTIPSAQELKDYDGHMDHEWVWVRDEPTHDNEDGTRKVLYSRTQDKKMQVNGSFMENCTVIKE